MPAISWLQLLKTFNIIYVVLALLSFGIIVNYGIMQNNENIFLMIILNRKYFQMRKCGPLCTRNY